MKELHAAKMYNIAEKYNISKVSVTDIIDRYIQYCKDILEAGYRVNFFGLVSVIPNDEAGKFSTTLAYDSREIARDLAMPEITVFEIIRAYVENLINDVKSGNDANIRGVVTVRPLKDETGKIVKVHSSISQVLNKNGKGYRVHTSKLLKHTILEEV